MSNDLPNSDSHSSPESEGRARQLSKDELWAMVKAKRNQATAPAPEPEPYYAPEEAAEEQYVQQQEQWEFSPESCYAEPEPAPVSNKSERLAAAKAAAQAAAQAAAEAVVAAQAAALAAAQAIAAAEADEDEEAEPAKPVRRTKPAPFQRQYAEEEAPPAYWDTPTEEEPFYPPVVEDTDTQPDYPADEPTAEWQLPHAESEPLEQDGYNFPAVHEVGLLEESEATPEARLSLDASEVEKPADNTATLKEAKRTALISSVSSFLGLLLLLGVIRIALPEPMPAEIVAFAEAEDDQTETNALKKVAQALPQAAPMAASLMPITASGVSDIAVPQITTTLTGSDLNIGTTLGTFGSGLTSGTAGGTVSFLGNRSVGKRVVFVVDVSSSMNAAGTLNGQSITRFELLKKELTRSVNGLPNGVQYQVVFFSDFGWAHDSVKPADEEARMKLQWDISPDTVAEAKIPRARYRTANLGNIKSSREIIAKTDNPGGTNWGSGLFIALKMSPPPDVIFFMTDGNASDDNGWTTAVTEANAKQGGKTIINTSAMMEPDAAVSLSDMAINNGGSFTVVLPNGKVVKGEDWFKGVRQ